MTPSGIAGSLCASVIAPETEAAFIVTAIVDVLPAAGAMLMTMSPERPVSWMSTLTTASAFTEPAPVSSLSCAWMMTPDSQELSAAPSPTSMSAARPLTMIEV